MPADPGSRFTGAPILETAGPDGRTRRVLALNIAEPAPALPGDRVHRVRHGERVDLVARRALGDAHLWWRVLDANPLLHPFDLAPGDLLRLPDAAPATRAVRTRSF
ncbi:hypothetical protein [Streptomyces sp. NPDC059010]|uniref:hypothetical protein n=1 Tax=Streptomyces sp. NPDC059010 TaxID=3346695 RepID=UPI0036755C41